MVGLIGLGKVTFPLMVDTVAWSKQINEHFWTWARLTGVNRKGHLLLVSTWALSRSSQGGRLYWCVRAALTDTKVSSLNTRSWPPYSLQPRVKVSDWGSSEGSPLGHGWLPSYSVFTWMPLGLCREWISSNQDTSHTVLRSSYVTLSYFNCPFKGHISKSSPILMFM